MSNEELPENQLYENESTAFKEVLTKYFGGEIPTETARKSAFKLLFDTTVFNTPTTTSDPLDGMNPQERQEWLDYNSY